MDCRSTVRQIKGAVETVVGNVELMADDPGLSGLSFSHPGHDAAVMVVVADADARTTQPTTTILIVLGDWDDLQKDPDDVFKLFSLNAQLMGCAVAVVPFNEDERAVVLCRRLPVDELAPEDVLPAIDGMAWEYASVSGWLEQAEKEALEEGRSGDKEADGE
jgi:hypothetical protein